MSQYGTPRPRTTRNAILHAIIFVAGSGLTRANRVQRSALVRSLMRSPAGVPGKVLLRDVVLVAVLVLPIELAHHLVRSNKPWLFLIAAVCALPVLGVVLKLGNARK